MCIARTERKRNTRWTRKPVLDVCWGVGVVGLANIHPARVGGGSCKPISDSMASLITRRSFSTLGRLCCLVSAALGQFVPETSTLFSGKTNIA